MLNASARSYSQMPPLDRLPGKVCHHLQSRADSHLQETMLAARGCALILSSALGTRMSYPPSSLVRVPSSVSAMARLLRTISKLGAAAKARSYASTASDSRPFSNMMAQIVSLSNTFAFLLQYYTRIK